MEDQTPSEWLEEQFEHIWESEGKVFRDIWSWNLEEWVDHFQCASGKRMIQIKEDDPGEWATDFRSFLDIEVEIYARQAA